MLFYLFFSWIYINLNFFNSNHPQTFPWIMSGPLYLDPIGSAVLTFIGYKQTNTHPYKQSLYIAGWSFLLIFFFGWWGEGEGIFFTTFLTFCFSHCTPLQLFLIINQIWKVCKYFSIFEVAWEVGNQQTSWTSTMQNKPPKFVSQTDTPPCSKSLRYAVINEPRLYRTASLWFLVLTCNTDLKKKIQHSGTRNLLKTNFVYWLPWFASYVDS